MNLSPLLAGVRAVAFDAVGTLILPEPPAAEVYGAVGRRFGSRRSVGDIARRFRAAFRREDQWDAANGWRTSEGRERERWQHIVAAVLDDVSDADACFCELFEHFAQAAAWRCVPEAGPVLTALAGHGLRLAVASNYDARLRRVAAGLPQLRSLDYLLISSEVGWRKPAPEFFEALGRTLGLEPQGILHVGDGWVNDYQAACAAGLRALYLAPASPARAGWIRGLDDLLAVGPCQADGQRE